MSPKRFIPAIIALFLAFIAIKAQSPNDEAAKRALQVGHVMQQERVYLHFDNSAYYLGETMWFKAYVSYGTNDRKTAPSKVLYVELVAPEGYVVETKKYKIDDNGCCNGEFELKPLLLSGYYEVRAYTRYMLNWGKDAIFSRVFPVFDKVNGDNWDFKNMLDRRRSWAEEGKWITPEESEAELKFYPEGGHLVAGLSSKVAYELRGLDGMLINEEITIYAEKEPLLTTSPTHQGKGVFEFTPQAGIKYTAEFSAEDKKGKKKKHKFKLPNIEESGVTITAGENTDNIVIKINSTSKKEIALALVHRGEINYYKEIGGATASFTIDKKELPEGVNKAIVFSDKIPLAERCLFVMHDSLQDNDRSSVKLIVTGNNEKIGNLALAPYEKIALKIAREDGKPIPAGADISLAVSDVAGNVKTSWDYNLYTYMLLGSEIKGYIPNAAQYFDKENANRKENLDLIMLTNGWTAYDWSKLTQDTLRNLHPTEYGITLCGAYYSKEREFKFLKGGIISIEPQSRNLVRFDISYDNENVSSYTFRTDSVGEFILELKDFYGKKVAALYPLTEQKQTDKRRYSFALDRYFSPKFRFYDYWERNIGVPFEEVKKGSFVQITPFDYGLEEVEVVEKAKKVSKSRPPHSETRYNFLDEWEYTQDEVALKDYNLYREIRYYKNTNNNKSLNEILAEIDKKEAETKEEKEEKEAEKQNIKDLKKSQLVFINSFSAGEITCSQRRFLNPPFLKYIGNMRFTGDDYELSHPPKFPSYREFTNSLTAADVVGSAMRRHNYNWAYWAQLMVVKGEYNSDSIPEPDFEYLRGKADAEKMMRFKEFVIRSDNKTREQFVNELNFWTRNAHLLDKKVPAQKFYLGFLSQQYILGRRKIDNFPSIESLAYELTSDMSIGISNPRHPNYVVCFIPYSEEEIKTGLIPDLSNSHGKQRFTSIQGYNESKQFYSPDYSHTKPSEEKDYRRTLLWNPETVIGEDGEINIELFNSYSCQYINVDVAGRAGELMFSNHAITETRINSKAEEYAEAIEKEVKKEEKDEDFINKEFNSEYKDICDKEHAKALKFYEEEKYKFAVMIWAELVKYKYPPALHHVAVCYEKGTGVKENLKAAKKFYEEGARRGYPASQYELGIRYRNGIGCEASDSLSIVWLNRASLQNEPRAMTEMAKYHLKKGTNEDVAKAGELLRAAAAQNCAEGLYCYAQYITDYMPAESKESAIGYIKQAAELEHTNAQLYMMNYEDSAENYQEAYKWARALSLANNHEGTKRLADYFFLGKGVKKDKKTAKDLYRKAAAEGNKEAEIICNEL